MFEHKYIRRYNTDEDYQEALDNRELEEAVVSAIVSDREELPDTYQYSTRKTNDDDKVLARFNAEDDIQYFGGLEIIWGYWGWVWNEIEYEGETLQGGHFDPIKNTTTYPMIQDGYRLQHINNLVQSTPNVNEVGYFDASNIVSAVNAFNKSSAFVYINTYDWPKLKNADNMFYVISKDIMRGHDLNMPELVTMNAPMASIFRYDDDVPIYINLGKVECLYLPNSLYYNSKGCGNNYSSVTRFPVSSMITGLDNCYIFKIKQYSLLSEGEFIYNGTIQSRANIDLEVTYEGDEVIVVPELSSFSRFKLSVPGKFGKSYQKGYTLKEVLVTCYGEASLNGIYQPLKSRRYANAIEEGLDVDYENITINNPNGYIAGFYFENDDELPFYSKLHDAIMYSYCRFDNMEIEFDCSEGAYQYNDSFGIKATYTEFYNCRFNNCSITMKDILNHDLIKINISYSTGTVMDIGLSEYSELNEKHINASKVSLPDIDGIEFTNCSLYANANISNCTIKRSKDYGDYGWAITGNVSNVTVENGPSKYNSHPSYRFVGEFENCSFSAYGNNIYLTAESGDYSSVTITDINDQTTVTLSKCVKTAVLKGYTPYSDIFSNDNILEEIYADELNCYKYSASDTSEGYFNFDLSNNTVLRILNLGKYWRTLKVNHAKLLDKDSLYNSIVRRGIEPTGELWLHRNVWSQYTQEEQDYINSQFNFVRIVEDETENEDEQTEQEP